MKTFLVKKIIIFRQIYLANYNNIKIFIKPINIIKKSLKY